MGTTEMSLFPQSNQGPFVLCPLIKAWFWEDEEAIPLQVKISHQAASYLWLPFKQPLTFKTCSRIAFLRQSIMEKIVSLLIALKLCVIIEELVFLNN